VGLRRAPWLIALFALALSCASPTLPVPPPLLPTMSASSTPGKVHLASDRGAEANALVIIYNRNPAVPRDQRVSGAQADDFGSWDAEVFASPGDFLDITQEFGTSRSAPVTAQVPR
jgi:hypothetical protein